MDLKEIITGLNSKIEEGQKQIEDSKKSIADTKAQIRKLQKSLENLQDDGNESKAIDITDKSPERKG